MERLQTGCTIVKESVAGFLADHAMLFAAAISFYAIISLAPLLVMAVTIAGAVYGEQAAQGEITQQIEGIVGAEGAAVVEVILTNASGPGSGTAALLSTGVLLFSASAVFSQLSTALNLIFGSKPRGKGVVSYIITKLTAIAFVIGIGIFVVLSLASGTVVARLQDMASQLTPGLASTGRWIEFFSMTLLFTIVYAVMFRVLPAARLRGAPLWTGALITSLLFNVGRYLVGIYLGHSAVGSSYGAAGSLLVLLMWIYYSSITLLLGAEFTKVFARRAAEECDR